MTSNPRRLAELSVILILLAACTVSCTLFPGYQRADQDQVTFTPTRQSTNTPTPWEPTPTRTRPVRSFFIRPTLAETPAPVDVPYPQPEVAESESSSTPSLETTSTPSSGQVSQVTQSITPSPTTTGIAPTPAREIVIEPLLLDFAMFDTNHGWGLTENMILRTTSGGVQWVDSTPIGFNTQSQAVPYGYFADVNHAWVLITRMNEISGTLFKTETGGNSWESDPVEFTNAAFTFLPDNSGSYRNGWALVDLSFTANSQAVDLYATADGGKNWELIHKATPLLGSQSGNLSYTGFKNGITFLNPLRGWITGESPTENQSWLYTTNDSGRSWFEQVLTLPTGSQTSTVITEPPFFFNDQQGLLPVRLEQISGLTVLYETVDGGANWRFTTPVPVVGPIDCVSPTVCRIWDGKVLAATENGGESWRQVTTNVDFTGDYFQIDFVDPLVGFAMVIENSGLSTSSTLYLTTDGGINWTAIW